MRSLPAGRQHDEAEMVVLREQFALWAFDPFHEGTQKEWAEKNGISPHTLKNWKNRPEYVQKMEEFRKTYRQEADEALQNLIRFSHSPEARVALPAIKILVEVMGYTQPMKVEVTARGMSLMDYLQHVGQKAVAEYAENSGQQAIPPMSVMEGSYQEVPETSVQADPWQTAEQLN